MACCLMRVCMSLDPSYTCSILLMFFNDTWERFWQGADQSLVIIRSAFLCLLSPTSSQFHSVSYFNVPLYLLSFFLLLRLSLSLSLTLSLYIYIYLYVYLSFCLCLSVFISPLFFSLSLTLVCKFALYTYFNIPSLSCPATLFYLIPYHPPLLPLLLLSFFLYLLLHSTFD